MSGGKGIPFRQIAGRLISGTVALLLLAGAAWAQPTVIQYADWSTSALIDQLIEEFESANPDIKVERVTVEWTGNNYMETLVTWLVAGQMPDVLAIVPEQLPALVESGALQELDRLIERDAHLVEPDDFFPATLEISNWNGKQYGLPTVLDVWVINVNRDAFASSGLPSPAELYERDAWTWEAMDESARKATLKSGDGTTERWGFYTFSGDGGIYPFLWGFGGDLFNEDKTASVIGHEPSINGISYMQRLMYEDGVLAFPSDWYGMPYEAPWQPTMTQGKFAMQPWWSGLPSEYKKLESGFDFDQVPFPPGPNNPNTNYIKANSLVIPSSTEQLEAAWKFLTFLTSQETQEFRFENSSAVPPRASLLSIWYEKQMSIGATGARFFSEGLNRARTQPLHSKIAEINRLLGEALGPIFLNEAAVAPTLTELERRLNTLLAE